MPLQTTPIPSFRAARVYSFCGVGPGVPRGRGRRSGCLSAVHPANGSRSSCHRRHGAPLRARTIAGNDPRRTPTLPLRPVSRPLSSRQLSSRPSGRPAAFTTRTSRNGRISPRLGFLFFLLIFFSRRRRFSHRGPMRRKLFKVVWYKLGMRYVLTRPPAVSNIFLIVCFTSQGNKKRKKKHLDLCGTRTVGYYTGDVFRC